MARKLPKEVEGKVIPDYIIDNCAKHPEKVFLTQPYSDGSVKHWTFAEFLTETKKMAGYIESLELPVPSQIAIMSKNCAWWLMADLAIMMTGHVGVPIYPTLTAKMTKYMLEHSETKLLFVGKLDKHPWNEMKNGIHESMKCVSFPMCPEGLTYDKWEDCLGEEVKEVKKRTEEEMATIIYTSGSTGMPKGVMISFKSMTKTTFYVEDNIINLNENDRYLSYLPISHGMERWFGECLPFITGMQIFYTDGLSTFHEDLIRCMPTFFVSVPRLWTKFQQGVLRKIEPNKMKKILKIPIVNRRFKQKVLQGLGFGCVRVAVSGSAPLPSDILNWYRKLGLNLLEGYGMTENFNYSHVNVPGKERAGFVGLPQEGVSQRITNDGEIQITSPGIMIGYFKNDDATKESFTKDGWFKTGDKGELDELGRLKITGRIKEIFKTSKGKYVAPAPIESQFISHPLIEMACVGGRGEPSAHVLVLLGHEAKKISKEGGDGKAQIKKEIEGFLKKINGGLDEHEKLQFLVIVNEEWLPENGFLTPSNKIKRAKIEEKYLQYLDEWYDSNEKVIWHNWEGRRRSLVDMARRSVSSMSSIATNTIRPMSIKCSESSVSKGDMKMLHFIAKCSECRDQLRSWCHV